MTSCINEVVLMGNLGHPPELRYFQDGTAHLRLSLATTDKWRDRSSGELFVDTQWHIVLFKGNLAQRVSDFMDVGDKLWLRGRIKHRQYTDDDGVVRSISEIHARELKMIWTKNKPKSIMVDDADFDDLEAEFLAQENQTVSMMIEEKLN
ncbi:Helix-destabilizing protein [Oligella ureolytica]|uniref:Single-stranded DNA-binding protein n=1 Tax=Oligella ureolytica TaxID=90244 RepID=A0A378XHW0_9BURK|nr:single-stranded DNA-binding protein [Oligella ureolytica]QPT39778.1 single-stranded DNA-binding protein [Oligella ureolytica]SUA57522.1 Helix-destabilizing protein [Oligella ureolytica]